eukprot:4935664-Prymnesium_polylepis.1
MCGDRRSVWRCDQNDMLCSPAWPRPRCFDWQRTAMRCGVPRVDSTHRARHEPARNGSQHVELGMPVPLGGTV